LSLLRNSTVVSTGTARTWGWNKSDFWSMTKVFVGAGNVLAGMASGYTTEIPFPPLTVPVCAALSNQAGHCEEEDPFRNLDVVGQAVAFLLLFPRQSSVRNPLPRMPSLWKPKASRWPE
jgi:hypothetical protein